MLLVGGLGGTLETGRVLDYTRAGDDNRKLCSLYLSLMDRMGVQARPLRRRRRRGSPDYKASASRLLTVSSRMPGLRLAFAANTQGIRCER